MSRLHEACRGCDSSDLPNGIQTKPPRQNPQDKTPQEKTPGQIPQDKTPGNKTLKTKQNKRGGGEFVKIIRQNQRLVLKRSQNLAKFSEN